MLVIGGTLAGFSNRMREDAYELKPCLNKTLNCEFQDAIDSENLDNIHECLEHLHNQDVHIVGSRGYVYHSGRLRELLEFTEGGAFIDLRLFPRTAGLRKSIETVLEKGENKCL